MIASPHSMRIEREIGRMQRRRRSHAGVATRNEIETSTSPSVTACPSLMWIFSTVPGSSASTGISIFIDSRITSTVPCSTLSPGLTSIFQTVPVMCAFASYAMGQQSSAGLPLHEEENSRLNLSAPTPLIQKLNKSHNKGFANAVELCDTAFSLVVTALSPS